MYKFLYLELILFLTLCGCSTANHGTFVRSTYVEPGKNETGSFLGNVTGESSQTWVLYIFPSGEAPSTTKAISDAQSKITGTEYLVDLSIDDSMYWGIGYSRQVIKVEGKAYKLEEF